MQKLVQAGPTKGDPGAMPVVALAHNEANILPDFLTHYRGLGPVHFLIVDDGSSDGTADLLANAPDVTVFHPVPGSSYAQDKAQWRSDLLDAFAHGRWCLVPDLDEHFVFAGAPTLAGYIAQVEAEGAQAVATLMIDMYADLPLSQHVHPEGSDIPLGHRFPLFDGPAPFPGGYIMRPISRATAEKFPTPPIAFSGGARDRLFYLRLDLAGAVARRAIMRWMGMDGPVNRRFAPWQRAVATQVVRRHFAGTLNNTKLGLIRWQAGMRFNGGAHKVDRLLPVSESIAGFLHYPFTRGRAGVEYIAARGQHAGGGKYYQRLLDSGLLDRSPVCPTTRRYSAPADLAGLIRPVPKPVQPRPSNTA